MLVANDRLESYRNRGRHDHNNFPRNKGMGAAGQQAPENRNKEGDQDLFIEGRSFHPMVILSV